MKLTRYSLFAVVAISAALLCAIAAYADDGDKAKDTEPGLVHCANLVYGNGKTSKCFADEFLSEIGKRSNVKAAPHFTAVPLESAELFDHPFAVMSGEGSFTLTSAQRDNLRDYLTRGGFLVASPSCSNQVWGDAFRREIEGIFPEVKLKRIDMKHAVFQTVFKINRLVGKRTGSEPFLMGLELDGRIVLIYSPDGLNDTANAGGSCCCCGGNEIRNAREVNVNLLAYALTH